MTDHTPIPLPPVTIANVARAIGFSALAVVIAVGITVLLAMFYLEGTP